MLIWAVVGFMVQKTKYWFDIVLGPKRDKIVYEKARKNKLNS